jgi:hypothetical protein
MALKKSKRARGVTTDWGQPKSAKFVSTKSSNLP